MLSIPLSALGAFLILNTMGATINAMVQGGLALSFSRLIDNSVVSMVRRAERITVERLNERLPVEDPHSDLGHMASAFNELLRRLEESFHATQAFHRRRFA